ncbi:transcription termination factor MTERF8, chloroplastic-like [Panicum virgatum]|uniref:transcription termination factor MTERF8, chloroplastic-like n=1 Tax=Panicum virgatum TaxID=38727 RepID=UPI0019D5B973|nr:transcription termination factor MTERF8, chloroplastic-like [Panicum virgatum]
MVVSHLRAALSLILRSPSHLRASSHAPPLILHSSAAAASSSGSFAAADYLVSRCGLTQSANTQTQALKAAAKISHLSSRARLDAVLAYLESTLRVPAADVTRVVVMDPTFLCADVEQTLAQRVADLRDLGLSRDQVARLLPLVPNSFRNSFLRSNLEFWLAEIGSLDKLLKVLRSCSGLLSMDLDKVARPNVAFLRQCGQDISEIAGTNLYVSRIFTMKPELLKETVQELGVVAVVAFIDKEVIARRILLLHNVGFSKDDVLAIVRKQPLVLGTSEQKIQGNMDFLMKDVGLETGLPGPAPSPQAALAAEQSSVRRGGLVVAFPPTELRAAARKGGDGASGGRRPPCARPWHRSPSQGVGRRAGDSKRRGAFPVTVAHKPKGERVGEMQ